LLTNKNEETDTLKWEGSRFWGLTHVPDRSGRVPSSARVPGIAYPCFSSSTDCAKELFKGFNRSASHLVCTQKNFFWLGVANFLWVTS